VLIVTPAPSDVHQLVAAELNTRLAAYLRTSDIGRPLLSPADVRRPDRRRNRLQPDVFVVKLREGKRPEYPYDLADLLLAVEIVSPSSVATDYHRKRDLYVGANVEYWVVDADARTVAVWPRGATSATLYTDTMRWQPEGMPVGLSIDLPELFVTALS
jgi:Uma2 family endonuclease